MMIGGGGIRFVFIEGLPGSGKTTLVTRLVEGLRAAETAAGPVWEGPTVDEPEQPLRVSPTLPHPQAPWEDLTIEGFINESLQRWRSFVRSRKASNQTIVCDGLLFHGNMTDLMLMGAPEAVLRQYVLDVLAILEPLCPVVVYLRQPDVERGLRAMVDERGTWWEEYQVNWKVNSPYGRSRGLRGFAGLVEIYVTYREICDRLIQ